MSGPQSKNVNVKEFIDNLDDDPELKAIAGTETSFGKNLEHKKMTSGLHKGMTAGGPFGMMPYTAAETFLRNPELQDRHIWFKDYAQDPKKTHNEITQILNDSPELAYDLARSHFNYLKGELPKKYYQWNRGQNTHPSKADIEKNDYTDKTLDNLDNIEGSKSTLLNRNLFRKLFTED